MTDHNHYANHLPEDLGFRTGEKGVHNTRSIMLDDLTVLLQELPIDATKEDYRSAISDDNILGKKTSSTRKYIAQRLAEVYALDPGVPLFRLLRHFWQDNEQGRPLLAMLCANARDPILRMTAAPVLALKPGDSFGKQMLEQVVAERAPGRFSETSQKKIARLAASSWTQSGHLSGRNSKTRVRPEVTPANIAYALVLGYLSGTRGALLFDTFWTKLLDTSAYVLHELAQEASRRGVLTYRNAGGIVELDFSQVLTEGEREAILE